MADRRTTAGLAAYLLGSALLSERIEADLRPFGIDRAEYEILVMLSESEDRRMRMAELADAVYQSRSRLTHTVTRMEKANLVQRRSCPTDRRGVWAELTAEGLDLIRTAAPHPCGDGAAQLRRGHVGGGVRGGRPGVLRRRGR